MPFTAEELRDALHAEAMDVTVTTTVPATLTRRRALQQVRMIAVPTAAVFIIAVLAAVFARPDHQPSIRLSAGPSALSAVLAATREAGTARVRVSLEGKSEQAGTPSSGEVLPPGAGDGVVDFRNGDGRIAVDYGRGQRFETITSGGITFVKYPDEFRDLIRVTTPWVVIEKAVDGAAARGDAPYGVPDEAIRALEGLNERSRSNLREVGREKVRGERTLHYKGQPSPVPLREGVTDATSTVEVWIDFDGILRRVRSAKTEVRDALTITTVVTHEYYDFGVRLSGVDSPPPHQVTKITDLEQLVNSGAAARRYPDASLPNYCDGRALLREAVAQEAPDREVVRMAINAIDDAVDTIKGSSMSDNAAKSRMRALGASARLLSLAIASGDGAEVLKAREGVTRALGSTADPC